MWESGSDPFWWREHGMDGAFLGIMERKKEKKNLLHFHSFEKKMHTIVLLSSFLCEPGIPCAQLPRLIPRAG